METKYRDFCQNYLKKMENDKENDKKMNDPRENRMMFFETILKDNIHFNLNMYVSVGLPVPGYRGENLFRLDDEDLEYLYNKYSKKIKDEMERNISELKHSYKDAAPNGTEE